MLIEIPPPLADHSCVQFLIQQPINSWSSWSDRVKSSLPDQSIDCWLLLRTSWRSMHTNSNIYMKNATDIIGNAACSSRHSTNPLLLINILSLLLLLAYYYVHTCSLNSTIGQRTSEEKISPNNSADAHHLSPYIYIHKT